MIKIDRQLLEEIGLGALSEIDQKSLIGQIIETLELRVGQKLANQMTEGQLEDFERYYNAKDEQGAYKWLETNFPNYKDIVQIEFDYLKNEIIQLAPQILQSINDNVSTNTTNDPNNLKPQDPINPSPPTLNN